MQVRPLASSAALPCGGGCTGAHWAGAGLHREPTHLLRVLRRSRLTSTPPRWRARRRMQNTKNLNAGLVQMPVTFDEEDSPFTPSLMFSDDGDEHWRTRFSVMSAVFGGASLTEAVASLQPLRPPHAATPVDHVTWRAPSMFTTVPSPHPTVRPKSRSVDSTPYKAPHHASTGGFIAGSAHTARHDACTSRPTTASSPRSSAAPSAPRTRRAPAVRRSVDSSTHTARNHSAAPSRHGAAPSASRMHRAPASFRDRTTTTRPQTIARPVSALSDASQSPRVGGGCKGPSAVKAPAAARVEAFPSPLPASRPRREWPRIWLRVALLLQLWARQCRSLARARYYCEVWRLRRGASRLAEWRRAHTLAATCAAEATRALSLRALRRSLASWALLASRGRVLRECAACGAARRQVRTFRAWRAWRQLKVQLKVRRRGEGAFGCCHASAVLARWSKAAQARRRLGCTAAVAERSLQRRWLAWAWRIQCAGRATSSARRALLARADTTARLRAEAAALQAWRWAAWLLWAATAALARSHPAWAVWRAAQRRRGDAQDASLGVAAAAHWAAGGSAVAWRRLREAGAAHRAVQSAQEWMRLRQIRGAVGRWGVRRAVGRARTRVRQEAWAWWQGRALRCSLLRWRLGPRAEALRARVRLRRGLGAWVQAGCTAHRAAASRAHSRAAALCRALDALRAHRHVCHSGLLSQLEVRVPASACAPRTAHRLDTALALAPGPKVPKGSHVFTVWPCGSCCVRPERVCRAKLGSGRNWLQTGFARNQMLAATRARSLCQSSTAAGPPLSMQSAWRGTRETLRQLFRCPCAHWSGRFCR